MKNNTFPKKQHWVPLFYLKNWATEDSYSSKNPQSWILSKNKNDVIKVNLRKLCAKRFLYSPEDQKGERSFETEKKLADYESMMSRFWPSICNNYFDFRKGTSIRKGLALFIAILYLRNPKRINEIQDTHAQILNIVGQLPMDPDGKPELKSIIYKGKEQEFDNSDYFDYKEYSDRDFQFFFVEYLNAEAASIAEILMNKRWAIVYSDKKCFITSDNPVLMYNLERERFGFNTIGTEISFPISPQRMLVMDDLFEEGDGKFYPLYEDRGYVSFNYPTWMNSLEFMISHRDPAIVCAEFIKDAQK